MKTNIKRYLAAATALVITTLSFAGCGSGDNYDDERGIGNYQPQYNDADYITAPEEEYNQDFEGNYNQDTDLYMPNTEEYTSLTENGYKLVSENPLSTFSTDVDTASYANVRRMLNNRQQVDSDAVRVEEFINYFNYDYEKPNGEDPISINTEFSTCPWNEDALLMLVGLQAEELVQDEKPDMNVVFLIDVSGSMNSDDKLPLIQQSFAMLTENLTSNDRVSIVTYAGQERVVLEGANGDDYNTIKKALYSLSSGGSTAGEAGINKAYDIAQENFIEGGNNRVILATDGDLNVGISSAEELTKLVETKRDNGVYLSVLGFGMGNYKDNRMEALADNGNGNYSYIDSIQEAEKVLVSEMNGTLYTVAKDVKLQLEFNPENVQAYRLVGYENRLLNDKDFEDDTKDAGDIGAGHTVTALYEIIPVSDNYTYEKELKYGSNSSENEDDQDIKPDTKIQESETQGELLTVSLRYKKPDEDKSRLMEHVVNLGQFSEKMPNNLAFASCAAGFGLCLKNSEYLSNYTYDTILKVMEDYDLANDEYREEFVTLVENCCTN